MRIGKPGIYMRNRKQVTNMKAIFIILLAVACQAHTPITEQSWVKFRKEKYPTYASSPQHGEPDVIHATDILIEQRISKISTMVRKSVSDFHTELKQYTTELTERIKRATAKADYGFVRKPELRHQYGMLFNHHGQVISGLKNMDLSCQLTCQRLRTYHMFHLHSPIVTVGPHHTNQTAITTCITLHWDSERTTTDP